MIAKQYRLSQPQVVQEAIASYRDNNDWLGHFLEDCCEVGLEYSAKSGEVYNAYRDYCLRSGEYIRSTTDFYAALESVGNFARRRTAKANMLSGLRLKDDFMG